MNTLITGWSNAGNLAECLGCLRRQSWRDTGDDMITRLIFFGRT